MHRLIILFFGALFLLAVTCERPVGITFPDEQQELVVISNFTTGKDLQVQVSLSRSITVPSGADYVINARVELFEGEDFIQRLNFVRPPEGAPYYTTEDFQAQIDQAYYIQVEVPSYERVIASATIPNSTPIQSIAIANLEKIQVGETLSNYNFDLQMSFDDPPGDRNYYHLKVFQQFKKFSILRNDTIISDTATRELVFSAEQNDNFQVAHYEGGLLLEDQPFDGNTKMINLPLSIPVATDEELPGKIIAELRTVSEPYYLFYSSVSRQRLAPTSPIAEPIIIFNHIENGNGVFAAYSQEIDSVAISPR